MKGDCENSYVLLWWNWRNWDCKARSLAALTADASSSSSLGAFRGLPCIFLTYVCVINLSSLSQEERWRPRIKRAFGIELGFNKWRIWDWIPTTVCCVFLEFLTILQFLATFLRSHRIVTSVPLPSSYLSKKKKTKCLPEGWCNFLIFNLFFIIFISKLISSIDIRDSEYF